MPKLLLGDTGKVLVTGGKVATDDCPATCCGCGNCCMGDGMPADELLCSVTIVWNGPACEDFFPNTADCPGETCFAGNDWNQFGFGIDSCPDNPINCVSRRVYNPARSGCLEASEPDPTSGNWCQPGTAYLNACSPCGVASTVTVRYGTVHNDDTDEDEFGWHAFITLAGTDCGSSGSIDRFNTFLGDSLAGVVTRASYSWTISSTTDTPENCPCPMETGPCPDVSMNCDTVANNETREEGESDEDLLDRAIAGLPEFPGTPPAGSDCSTLRQLSGDLASVRKERYQFFYTSPAISGFSFDWVIRFEPEGGGDPVDTPMSLTPTLGSEQSDVYYIDVPDAYGTSYFLDSAFTSSCE